MRRLKAESKRPNIRNPSEKESDKKGLQFSQKMTLISAIFSMVFVTVMNIANFLLLWNDKMSMSQEVIASINTYGGITATLTFGGYCALTLGRNISENISNPERKDNDE